jgi:glycosyltransferase involved in cell wall biosynthesis
LKVLFIHNRYQQAGGEDLAFELEAELLRQNHSVEVLLFSNDKIVTGFNKFKAAVTSIYSVSSALKVKKAIQLYKPDIIHVHNLFFDASPSVLASAYRQKVPVVVTLHNYRLICANALLLRNNQVCELCIDKKLPTAGIRYKCYRNSAVQSAVVTAITGIHKLIKSWNKYVYQYICLTEFSKEKLLYSSLQLNEKQLLVVPNFVPDPKAYFNIRENFFLYVGRISKEKGVDVLLKAFLKLKTQNLVIIGDGPEKNILERQYTAANIIFAGQKNKTDVLDLMSKAKALVFPSLCYENLPFTIIESYSTATPVIASGLGAMLEIVNDGYNGFHFMPGDVEDLEKALLKFLNLNEEQKRKIYAQARISYEEKFHPDIHYRALMNVYEKAIEENKR